MGITFKQLSPTSSGASATFSSACTAGSLLIASLLVVSDASVPNPSVSDATNGTWNGPVSVSQSIYSPNRNNVFLFWVLNQATTALSLTLSITGTGTTRLWGLEYTGQAPGNPIVAAAGGVLLGLGLGANAATPMGVEGTGSLPMSIRYSNLTSVGSFWSDNNAYSAFDGGSGTVRATGGAGAVLAADHVFSVNGGTYNPTFTQTQANQTSDGNVVLIAAANSSTLASNPAVLVSDTTVAAGTNWRGIGGGAQYIGGVGCRPAKIVLAANGTISPGNVVINEILSGGSTGPVVFEANIPSGFTNAEYDLTGSAVGWRDFIVTGLTATNTAMELHYRP